MSRKGQITKAKVIEGAIDLCYEKGFAAISTRQLSEKIGMSSSAIYNNFKNMEDILFTIIRHAGYKVHNLLSQIMSKYSEPEECLKEMISGMINLYGRDEMRKEISIFSNELNQLPEDLREICNQQHLQIIGIFQQKIFEINDKKKYDKINEKVAAFNILAAMHWVYRWYDDSGSLSLQDITDELIKQFFDGITGK